MLVFYSSANIVFRSGWTAWTLQWWWQRWAVWAGVTPKRPGPWPVASPWAASQVRAFYSEKSHHSLSLPDRNSSGKDSDVTVIFGWLSKHKWQPTGLGHHNPYKYVRPYINQTTCTYLMRFSTSSTNLTLCLTLIISHHIISIHCVLLKHNNSLVHIRN